MKRVRPSMRLPSAFLVLALLLCACNPAPGEDHRVLQIEGVTTQLSVQLPFVYVESLGHTSLSDHPSFRMDEWVVPTPLTLIDPEGFSPNFGVISIPPQEGGTSNVCIGFLGRAMGGEVIGFFRAIETSDPCPPPFHSVYWKIDGIYTGIVDTCDFGCTPLLDPGCPSQFENPACSGFTVELVFD